MAVLTGEGHLVFEEGGGPGALDEGGKGGDGVGAHQGLTPELATVHHPDSHRGHVDLPLRKVLQHNKELEKVQYAS